MSSDTSACVSAGFQNFDLHAMMLTNPEGPGAQAATVKGMAGILITLSCLNEDEWKLRGFTHWEASINPLLEGFPMEKLL